MQPALRRHIIQRPRLGHQRIGIAQGHQAFTAPFTACTCASQAAITSDGATLRAWIARQLGGRPFQHGFLFSKYPTGVRGV
jgi:hypothetical protein